MPLTAQSALNKDRRTGKSVSLQHRHYAFIAAVLKANKPAPHWDANKMAQWFTTVTEFADACRNTNPNFDRERFYKACDF